MNDDSPAISADRLEDLRRRLLAAVRRHCPAYMASHAEDIAQEALIKIVGIFQRSGETECALPSSYINRAAYHSLVDAMRSNRIKGKTELAMVDEADQIADKKTQADPERNSISSAIRQGMKQCLAALVEARRAAVVLHLQGHSGPEICSLLDWKQTKTTNLVYRGLKDLRHCLKNKGLSP